MPVASLPKLDVQKSEPWGGRRQEWGIPSQRDALGCKQCVWSPGLKYLSRKQASPAEFSEGPSDIPRLQDSDS